MTNFKEFLTEATTKWSELVAKYSIKNRPRYLDARHVKTYKSVNDKGITIFEIDNDDGEYTLHVKDRSKTFANIDLLAKYLEKQKFQTVLPKKSDQEIAKWIGREIMHDRLKVDHIKHLGYIVWGPKSIQLVERGTDPVIYDIPYVIFVEGSRGGDERAALGEINMTAKEFEEWLKKHGAVEKPKPKRSPSVPYYD